MNPVDTITRTFGGEAAFAASCAGLIVFAVLVQMYRSARSFLADLSSAERAGEI